MSESRDGKHVRRWWWRLTHSYVSSLGCERPETSCSEVRPSSILRPSDVCRELKSEGTGLEVLRGNGYLVVTWVTRRRPQRQI